MSKYRVTFNTHKYADCGDRPQQRSLAVEAETPDDAREKVRDMRFSGRRHIGMVFDAEPEQTVQEQLFGEQQP